MASDRERRHGESRHRRYSTEEKYQAVLRILAGEDTACLASELNVSQERVRGWHEAFVSAGRQELSQGTSGHSHHGLLDRLKKFQQRALPWATVLATLLLLIWMLTHYANSTTMEP